MARDVDGIIKQKFAETGDVGLGGLDLSELWPIAYSTPGGAFPQRIQFNQLFRYLSALGVEINSKGPFLSYDGTDPTGPDYEIGAIVRGSDLALYQVLIANGPSSTIVDPVGDVTGTWEEALDSTIITPDRAAASDGAGLLVASPTTAAELAFVSGVTSAIQAQIDAKSALGVGQTWQDMTASRSVGVTYTNSTGKPIMISIKFTGVDAGVLLDIDGDNVMTSDISSAANSVGMSAVGVVPNGSTYLIHSGGGTYASFFELR